MLRNKKYGMGGAVQSFSSPMLAQGMQGGLSGFGTSGLGTFADGGQVGDFAKKNIGKKVRVNFRKEQGIIVGGEGDFVSINYPTLGFTESVNAKLEPIYFVENSKYAKGGEISKDFDVVVQLPNGLITKKDFDGFSKDEIIQWCEERGWKYNSNGEKLGGQVLKNYEFFVKESKRVNVGLLPHKKYAKGGQIASIGDSGIITDKNSMFVGKMALITGDLGNMYEVRVGERTTIVKKNGIRIVSDEYAHGGEIHNSAKQMSDEDFEIAYNKLTPSEKNEVKSLIRLGDDKKLALATILAESKKPSSSDFYKRAYEYANGGEITHLPEAKKVSKEDIEQFIRYVDSFYGKNGIYADYYEGVNSKAQIRKAVMTYLNKLDSQQTWGGGAGDSLDRERVGQILKPTSKPTYAKGGQTSTYEVHLEAVPNRDFDQSSHEANVRVPKLKKSAKSVDQAVAIAKKFIQDNDLGGSNFLPAKLYKNGKQVGFISYNGRVWNSDQSEMKYAQGGEMESEDMDVQFIEYKDNEIMYEPHYKKYYANDVEFDSLKDAQKFLDSGKISNDIRGAYQRGLFAQGGQIKPKTSRITLIMDGQKYSYPVALVNGRVEVTEETFKDGVVREYLDKEFDLWLQQAPTDYEEMYYGDEDVMSKSGAIEGAMEIVISTIEEEAPKKMTFNFDEGDVEFYEAYQYARGGSIAVSDDEKKKSLKGNLKIKF